MLDTELRGAAAAGLLRGILAGWRHDANPGALDDLTMAEWTYADTSAGVTLEFADGRSYYLVCVCMHGPNGSERQ